MPDHRDVIRAIEPAVADNLDLLAPARQGLAAHRLPAGSRGRELAGRGRALPDRRPRRSPMSCWSSWSATWSPKKRCPAIRSSLNGLVRDDEGTSPAPWARWLRGLDRRGKPARRPAQRLPPSHRPRGHARRGTDGPPSRSPTASIRKSQADPYNLLVYTSFQERATRMSHGNVGRIAARDGDANLARICGDDRRRRSPARGVLHAHDGRGARTRSGGRHPRVPIDAPRPHRDARPVHGRRQGSRSVRSLRDRRPAHQRLHRARLRRPSSSTSSRPGTSQGGR